MSLIFEMTWKKVNLDIIKWHARKTCQKKCLRVQNESAIRQRGTVLWIQNNNLGTLEGVLFVLLSVSVWKVKGLQCDQQLQLYLVRYYICILNASDFGQCMEMRIVSASCHRCPTLLNIQCSFSLIFSEAHSEMPHHYCICNYWTSFITCHRCLHILIFIHWASFKSKNMSDTTHFIDLKPHPPLARFHPLIVQPSD